MTHPSLALWNGNNENIWGYFDWGWQPVLGGRSWGAGFYFDLLPRVVRRASTRIGRTGRAARTRGRWRSLRTPMPTGASTSGACGTSSTTPATATARRGSSPSSAGRLRRRGRRCAAPISDDPLTPDVARRCCTTRRRTDGNGKLERGLAHHVDVPTDFDAWLWATQLNQARAVRTGVEHFRSLRGTCMGTIWWQLNDCWPVTSWAVVDGAGRPKPAWFALRDAYAPRLLTIQPRGSELVLFAVNDGDEEWSLTGSVDPRTFDGEVLAGDEVSLRVGPCSIVAWDLPPGIARAGDATAEVVRAVAGGSDGMVVVRSRPRPALSGGGGVARAARTGRRGAPLRRAGGHDGA